MTTALSWYGGKTLILTAILKVIETINHNLFCDVFGGSGAVVLGKKSQKGDVYNDINSGLYNFMWVLRNQPDALTQVLKLTPYSKQELQACANWMTETDPVEKARQFFVATQQSFSAKGAQAGWSSGRVSNRGLTKQVSGWLTKVDDKLPAMIAKVRELQVDQLDFEACIDKYDAPTTLFYLDPPYLPATRAAKKVYDHEMSYAEHERLVKILSGIKGKAILSGYANTLYDVLNWSKIDLGAQPMHASTKSTKRRKTEMLWIKTN